MIWYRLNVNETYRSEQAAMKNENRYQKRKSI